MFTRENSKIVCKKFIPTGIYRAVMSLEDGAVVFCAKGVIEDFEGFVSRNVRLRRAVNKKRIELKPLRQEKTPRRPKTPEKPKPPKKLVTRDGSEKAREVE